MGVYWRAGAIQSCFQSRQDAAGVASQVAHCPTCGQRTDRATLEQKKRYFALIGLIMEKGHEKGIRYSKEDLSDMLKLKFLGAEEKTLPNGKTITLLPSLASMDVRQMAEYQDQCEAWAADRGIWLDS